MTTFCNKKMTGLAVSLSLVASSVISANALEKQEEGSIENADLSNVIGERAVAERTASGSVVYKVTENSLNVRKGPGTSYSSVGKMNAGDIVDVHEIKNGWARITYKGDNSVYCSASYITKVTRTGKALQSVYLRKTYSWDAETIALVKAGSQVEIVAIGEYWAKLKYNGQTGYFAKQYLQETTPTSTVSGGSIGGTTSISKATITGGVYLRATASWSATKLLTINKGEEVEILEKGTDWVKIKYSGKTGYVPVDYVKISSSSTNGSTSGSVTSASKGIITGAVNLRATASWSATKLLTINKGEEVEILEKGTDWVKIKYSGKTGYVPVDYVKISSSSTNGSTSGGASTDVATNATITDATYIRATASWSAEKLLLLNKGDKVTAISKTGDWVKVTSSGKTGYVSADFIKITGEIEDAGTTTETTTKYVVDTASLNVRSGAGTNYSIVGSLKSGEVIDVYSITNGWAKIKFNNAVAYVSSSYIKKQSSTSTSTDNKSKIIFLDAGHGGKDPGAIGTTYKTYEKEATLDVNNRVVKKLQGKGYTVKCSRSTDEYIALLERTSKANSAGATIFVSVHFNSSSTSSAAGIETLYKVDARTSNVLADKIQSSMISATGLKSRGLKTRTDLSVLNNSKMPAVLIEGGFLSNPGDENLIKSSSYRETLANSIVTGIENYFKVSK